MRMHLSIFLVLCFCATGVFAQVAQGDTAQEIFIKGSQVKAKELLIDSPGMKVQGFNAQDSGSKPQEISAEHSGSKLTLVFAGDIMGHDTQIASALAMGDSVYDYHPSFQYIKPYLQEADLVVGNLEVTLAGPPYKGYPQFSSPDALADALVDAGFDILVTANNHALDRRSTGLIRTLEQLEEREFLYTGTFKDTSERDLYYPLLFEKNGIRIALLNYTYSTNGLKVKPPNIVNPIDTLLIKSDLEKALSAQPDVVIACMHWGNEYQLKESSAQRTLAELLFRNGTDVIIGSHPHVVQPVKGSGMGNLVVYSLGNLISNQRKRYRDGGILFQLELVKKEDQTHVLDYGYLPVWVYKPKTSNGTLFTLVPANADSLSYPRATMGSEDKKSMDLFLKDTRSQLTGIQEIKPDWLD